MHVHLGAVEEGDEEHPEKFVRVSDARYPFTPCENLGGKEEMSVRRPVTPVMASSSAGLAVETDEGVSTMPRQTAAGLKVKDLSRLYMYVNGGSPPESPVAPRRSGTF
ncbi:hypothetical protein V491_08514 [Pseudogymnoascus sp. VKM F-3775]|nr:hypothetical protein V491_08514 [Pseudogymnoascus sp. VKM F-3775]